MTFSYNLLVWPSRVTFCYGLLVCPSGMVFCYGLLLWPSGVAFSYGLLVWPSVVQLYNKQVVHILLECFLVLVSFLRRCKILSETTPKHITKVPERSKSLQWYDFTSMYRHLPLYTNFTIDLCYVPLVCAL